MKDSKREELKEEVRLRLRSVCNHMNESAFEELVSKIADNELKARSRSMGLGAAEPIPPT